MNNQEVFVKKEIGENGLAICLKPGTPYVITPSLIHNLRGIQNQIVHDYMIRPWDNFLYVFWYLHSDQIPVLGLDFNYIYQNIKNNNEIAVEKYFQETIDVMCLNYIGLALPIINCSFVNWGMNGCAKEFFYMNQINFIQRKPTGDDRSNDDEVKPIKDIDQNLVINFPEKIYASNEYYSYDCINIHLMREIIKNFNFKPKTESDIQTIQDIFDDMRVKTLEKIYDKAARNIMALKKLSDYQSFLYRRYQ